MSKRGANEGWLVTEIKRLRRNMARAIPKTLSLAVVALAFCIFTAIRVQLILMRVIAESPVASLPPTLVAQYARIQTAKALVFWVVVSVVCLALPLLFLFSSWAWHISFSLTKTLAIISKWTHEPRYRQYARYNTLLARAFRLPNRILLALVFLAVLISGLLQVRADRLSAQSVLHCFFGTIMLVTAVVFVVHWTLLLRIYRRKSKKERFSWFLFSNESFRFRFQAFAAFLLTLAIIGHLTIPGIFLVAQTAAEQGQRWLTSTIAYEATRRQLQEEGFERNGGFVTDSIWALPPSKKLVDILWPFSRAGTLDIWKQRNREFLSMLFLVLFLGMFLDVGLPSIIRSMLSIGYLKTTKRILMASIRSFVVLLIIRVFVGPAFLVDFGKPLGLGSLFLFLVSFFLKTGTAESDSLTATSRTGPD